MKAEVGILETDSPRVVAEKLTRSIGNLAHDAQEAQWLERHLQPLVGVTEGSARGVDEAFAAWRRFLELVAERGQIVCVFEDLHWADDALLDFVDTLVERSGAVPMLVLATARPELLQRRPGWGGGKPNALAISLTSLSDDDASLLVGHLIERVLNPDERAALVARAGGNPLYAEQFVRLLNERGELDALPESVQGIIAARLDALPDREKRLLQDAAVVGKVFWLGAVEAVDGLTRWEAEELLHVLERKEFVQRSRASSVGSETEYSFRHVLIRDVAYGQIPRAGRAGKHERVATWIDSLGRSDDQAELVAHHYLQALELTEATGGSTSSLAGAARRAFRDAGERAAALSAAESARKLFDAALRLTPPDDPDRAYLLVRRAAPLGGTDVAASDTPLLYETLEELVRLGDTTRQAELQRLISRSYWLQGAPEQAVEHMRRAEELLRDAPPNRTTVEVLCGRASLAMLSGASREALPDTEHAVRLAEELELTDVQAEALQLRGSARVGLGDDAGIEDLHRSGDLLRSIGALGLLSRHFNSLSVARIQLGDLRAASEARRESGRIAEQVGSEVGTRWFLGVGSDQLYREGEWDEALEVCDTFLARVDAGEPHYLAAQVACVRAEIRLGRGDDAGAVTDMERGLREARAIGDPQVTHYATALATHVLSFLDPERARQLADELFELLESDGELQFSVIELPAFAAAAHRLGVADRLEAAVAHRGSRPWIQVVRAYATGDFVRAADLLFEIGSLPDEAEARVLAGGDQRERGLAFFRSVGAARFDSPG